MASDSKSESDSDSGSGSGSGEDGGSEPIAVVLISRREGREFVDTEHRVRTLQELYDLCRHAAPGQLMKVHLRGPEGEIRLHFGSFIARRS